MSGLDTPSIYHNLRRVGHYPARTQQQRYCSRKVLPRTIATANACSKHVPPDTGSPNCRFDEFASALSSSTDTHVSADWTIEAETKPFLDAVISRGRTKNWRKGRLVVRRAEPSPIQWFALHDPGTSRLIFTPQLIACILLQYITRLQLPRIRLK